MKCSIDECQKDATEIVRLSSGKVLSTLCPEHFDLYAYFFTKEIQKRQEKGWK
jgi:hypothetical protein